MPSRSQGHQHQASAVWLYKGRGRWFSPPRPPSTKLLSQRGFKCHQDIWRSFTLNEFGCRWGWTRDAKVTLNHYAHLVADAERAASEKLSRRIGAKLESDRELEPVSPANSA